MPRHGKTGLRGRSPQQLAGDDGICGSRPSACRGLRHARLQPALGHCKKTCAFARGKGFVETEHAAVTAVALGAMDREGGAKAATVGPVCRGRNDVLAHGNADVWNLVHSGSQACTKLREPSGNALAAALQTNGRQRSRRKPARANGSLQALRQLNESNLWPATACIISPICMSSLFIILSGFKDARLGKRARPSAALRRSVRGAAARQPPCTACGCSGRVSAAPGAAAQLQAWRPAVSACLPLAVAVLMWRPLSGSMGVPVRRPKLSRTSFQERRRASGRRQAIGLSGEGRRQRRAPHAGRCGEANGSPARDQEAHRDLLHALCFLTWV